MAQLGAMLSQLVEALQLHTVTSALHSDVVLLRPLIDKLAAEFAEVADAKGIVLFIPRALGAVFSHLVLLRVMVRHLLRNAIDYTPTGGRVLVLCKRGGAELRIEVHDSGPGIPENMKSRLFEAFARADPDPPRGSRPRALHREVRRGPIAASGRDRLHARAGLLLCGGRESRRWTRLRADSLRPNSCNCVANR